MNFTDCRLLGHNWEYTTVTEKGWHYLQGLVCVRCSTKRTWRIHKRSGRPVGNTYDYAKGYQVDGGMSLKDKDALRLNEIQSHIE